MKRRIFISYLMVVILAFGLSACALSTKTRTLEEIRSNLNCITCEEGTKWKSIQEEFGDPDYAPRPTEGKLSQNTRIYRDRFIIFYTELKRIKVGGKIRFEEVVTKLEICEEK